MREILFKAKRIDDGKWVEGYYQKRYDLLGNEEHLIFHADSYKVWEYAEVDPETICQYTGLCDKNGKKIWEGDIISYQRDNDDCPFPNKDTKKRFGKVFYQGFRSTFAIGMGRNGSRPRKSYTLWRRGRYFQYASCVSLLQSLQISFKTRRI